MTRQPAYARCQLDHQLQHTTVRLAKPRVPTVRSTTVHHHVHCSRQIPCWALTGLAMRTHLAADSHGEVEQQRSLLEGCLSQGLSHAAACLRKSAHEDRRCSHHMPCPTH